MVVVTDVVVVVVVVAVVVTGVGVAVAVFRINMKINRTGGRGTFAFEE